MKKLLLIPILYIFCLFSVQAAELKKVEVVAKNPQIQVIVEQDDIKTVNVMVYDMLGNVVASERFTSLQEKNIFTFDGSDFIPGTHFVKVFASNGQVKMIRFNY